MATYDQVRVTEWKIVEDLQALIPIAKAMLGRCYTRHHEQAEHVGKPLRPPAGGSLGFIWAPWLAGSSPIITMAQRQLTRAQRNKLQSYYLAVARRQKEAADAHRIITADEAASLKQAYGITPEMEQGNFAPQWWH